MQCGQFMTAGFGEKLLVLDEDANTEEVHLELLLTFPKQHGGGGYVMLSYVLINSVSIMSSSIRTTLIDWKSYHHHIRLHSSLLEKCDRSSQGLCKTTPERPRSVNLSRGHGKVPTFHDNFACPTGVGGSSGDGGFAPLVGMMCLVVWKARHNKRSPSYISSPSRIIINDPTHLILLVQVTQYLTTLMHSQLTRCFYAQSADSMLS